jgi:hypothetical protein
MCLALYYREQCSCFKLPKHKTFIFVKKSQVIHLCFHTLPRYCRDDITLNDFEIETHSLPKPFAPNVSW